MLAVLALAAGAAASSPVRAQTVTDEPAAITSKYGQLSRAAGVAAPAGVIYVGRPPSSSSAPPAGEIVAGGAIIGAGNVDISSPPVVGSVVTEPTLVSPLCGTTLLGPAQHFEWTGPASGYRLAVGTSPSRTNDVFDSGPLDAAASSVDVPDLPTDGRKLFVSLGWRFLTGAWRARGCYATAASLPRPALVSPTCGATLAGAGAQFAWAANGWPVTGWRLKIGATKGSAEYFDSGVVGTATLAADVATLPGDGSPVYARLRYRTRLGGWANADCSFTAATLTAPALVLPACGSTLAGPDVAFSWGDNGWAIAGWRLRIGTTQGGNDVLDTGKLPAGVTDAAVTGLPADGETLYVRLKYQPYGFPKWLSTDCSVTAQSLPKPMLTGPACGGSLTGTSTAFAWDDGGRAAQDWRLSVSDAAAGAVLFDSGSLGAAARSVVATGLPRDGRPVRARLRWLEGGAWQRVDCPYTAFAGRTRRSTAQYSLTYTSTCSGSGLVFAALSPCTLSCPSSGPLDLQLEESGSATPPAPPLQDLSGVWRGGQMSYGCARDSDGISVRRFLMSQTGPSLAGRFAGDAGANELAGDGCTVSCPAPGACHLRCSNPRFTLDCNVSCTPATKACRSEFDVTGTVQAGGDFSLAGQRQQEIRMLCGPSGTVTLQEHEQFDAVAPPFQP
jgi:hypothetical protein